MKMREAFEKIKELAGDRAAAAEFTMSTYNKPACGLYIADTGWFNADSWENALDKLMGNEVITPPDEEEKSDAT